jgi:ankyrin repeat protein
MWAAGNNNGDAVRVLVAGGARPDTVSSEINLIKRLSIFLLRLPTALPRGAMTAAMYAAREGQLDGVTALADAGANLNIVDPEGSTAMVIAIINAHYEVAARLAEKGADPNIGDAAGMAALYAAVDMMHPASLTNRPPQVRTGKLSAEDLVTVLLKHGADPNIALKAPLLMRQHNAGDATLAAGATPLMRASKALDIQVMKALLDYRADPSRALANGTTTLSVALTGRGARALTPETPMYQAVKLLLDRGADVNAAGANGSTLLHQSLDRGAAFVRLLVEHGAKLDAKIPVAERRSTSRSVWRPLHRLQARLDAAVRGGAEAPEPRSRRRDPQVRRCSGPGSHRAVCAAREPAQSALSVH